MKEKNVAQQIQACAKLFYQNREAEAYDQLNLLLQEINRILQEAAVSTAQAAGGEGREMNEYVLQLTEEFVNAYQAKDNLALADLLYYNIPELTASLAEA